MKAIIKYEHKPKKKVSIVKIFREMYDLTYDEVDDICNNRMGTFSSDKSFEKFSDIYVRPALFELPEIQDNDGWETAGEQQQWSEINLNAMSAKNQFLIETGCVAETIFQTRAYAIFVVRILKLVGGVVSEDNGKSWQTRQAFKSKYQPLITLSRQKAIKFSTPELVNFAKE